MPGRTPHVFKPQGHSVVIRFRTMLRSALRLSAFGYACRLAPALGARWLSKASRAMSPLSTALGSYRPATRASLILLVLVVTGTTDGIRPSSAHADVFTNLSLPTITGTAVEGQTLSEMHATWSAQPAGYAYQWQRCDSAGNDCESIPKARMQTYRLVAADVGFTIRVGENARDAEGAVTPSVSAPTAVVQALATGEHQGGAGGHGGVPPVSCCNTPAHVNPAEIKILLARQLAPSGKRVSTSALLKHGGLRMSFMFPETGALVVQWYLVAPGAKLARKLVAAGHATCTAGETVSVRIRLTARGRKLLRHAKKIYLEAKGAFAAKGEVAVGATKKLALKR